MCAETKTYLAIILGRLGLGTAEFGIPYGAVTNLPPPGMGELRTILDISAKRGVRILDTAPAYGESESRLGRAGVSKSNFKIVTKTPVHRQKNVSESVGEEIEQVFEHSLKRLRVESAYALLVHHGTDLLKPGGERIFIRVQRRPFAVVWRSNRGSVAPVGFGAGRDS